MHKYLLEEADPIHHLESMHAGVTPLSSAFLYGKVLVLRKTKLMDGVETATACVKCLNVSC